MSGKKIGKKNRLYYPAQQMYVEEPLSLVQVQARLMEVYGEAGYISDTTLGKWRKGGSWDERRAAVAEAESVAALMESLEKRIIGASERLAAALGKLSAAAMPPCSLFPRA
mgnify:CR=1 FL=1